LWDKIKKEYKSKKFYQEIYEKISELLEESAQDTKYVLEKIVNDYSENWIYVYQKLKLTEESEVRVFVDSVLNIISETEDEKIKEIIKNFKLNS
jgi:biotin-(acetyl-CoA carboxylase) ligase